jgi:Zn-dependent protease/predicted transcriptional regulator
MSAEAAMTSSFKLGRIFGVDVGVHWSWIFIFLIVTWSFATGLLDHFYPDWTAGQRWTAGAFVAGIFFLSVLAHELSHALVSNRSGLPVRGITLFVFGGVANLSKEPDDAKTEFRIAIVGPATSLALGALFAVGWLALNPFSDGLAGISANLALINASLAVFNMLPGFPLDGGRVFRSFVWSRNGDRLRATRLASRVGEVIAYGVMAIGVAFTLFGGWLSGIWFLLIGFFLRNASTASYEQLLIDSTLSGIAVRDVMRRDVNAVPPDMSVEELVQEGMLRQHARAFAVMAAGDFAGLITLTDVRRVPREEWQATSVYRAMTPATKLHTVSPNENLTKVLQMMAMHDVHQLPVVHGRELVGMLDRGDVMRFIQVRRELAEDGAPVAPVEPASDGARPTSHADTTTR